MTRDEKIEAKVQRVSALSDEEQIAWIVEKFEAMPADYKERVIAYLKANPPASEK